MILSRLKKSAEVHLKKSLKKIVLGVPVEFEEGQKKAIEHAANQAGMEVLRTIYEPTAAAMAFGLHERNSFMTIMIFDFGGGTLDCSILSVSRGLFEVLAISGDEHLGGEDFTHNLLSRFISESYVTKYGHDLEEKEFVQILRQHVEEAKIKLSTEIKVYMNFFHTFKDGFKIHFLETLTREEFVQINQHLFDSILYPVAQVLNDANMEASEIDEVVEVGGASLMPQVNTVLEKYFGKKPNSKVDPRQAIAIGTALQAAICADMWPLPVAAREKPRYNVTKSITKKSKQL